MKKLMIPAIVALMSVGALAEDAAKPADVDAAAQAGIKAGPTKNYVDEEGGKVIAHTKLIGGGEKTDVTFKTDVFEAKGDYDFFCSFPGHYAVMRGKVIVE